VAVARAGDRAIVEDEGIGGADLTRGSGLRGLADRIGALGGTLAIDSRQGRARPSERACPATENRALENPDGWGLETITAQSRGDPPGVG
jgi:hypothetical protein